MSVEPEAKDEETEEAKKQTEIEEAGKAKEEVAAAEAIVEEPGTPFVVENTAAKGKKAALIAACVLLGVLLTAYVGGCIYFAGHFGFSTNVNGVDVSCAALDDAQNRMRDAFLNYRLVVEGKDERSCEVEVPDINMKVQLEDSMQDIRRQQNIFLWPVTLIEENALSVKCDVTYDEELLREHLYASHLFEPEGYEPSRDAQIIYDGKKITIEKEFYGNTLYKTKLVETVGQSIEQMEEQLLLADTDCYILPSLTEEDEELQKKYQILEPYSDVKLTYKLGIDTYEITPDMYMDAISYDENGSTWFDKNRLSALIHIAAEKINTAYSDRHFKTSVGKYVDVTGPYGYIMDEEQELISLCKMLRNKESEQREPIYSQEGFVRRSLEDDIGSTYVEVNLTTQHIYVYYEGSLYLESGIVTGNPNKGNRTPGGIYGVSYKQSPAVLRGRDYETPVTYWMPFNGGIGLHDATWQSSFGGKRYLYHGSHGCVNLPLSVARKIYKICEKQMPVICYYENGEHANGRKR